MTTTPEETEEKKNYTLENSSRYWLQFFSDSLFKVQVPRADGTIIESGMMLTDGANPYTYNPVDIPNNAFVLVTDRHDNYETYECHSLAETIVCDSAPFPLDTFFIPWERVAPNALR